MLELLLDDSKTYQHTPKAFFLEKLELAFTEFRESLDTDLIAISGKCVNKDCPNNGCKGFSFVGNTSGQHLDLIFEETETDYSDICQCRDFDPVFKPEHLTQTIDLDIKHDEYIDFKPDIDFLISSQKCRMACDELKEAGKSELIGPAIFLNWLEKYKELFQTFDLPPIFYRDYYDFYSLYIDVNNLAVFLDNEKLAQKAYSEYLLIPPGDEEQLLRWLNCYEELNGNLILFPFPDMPSAKDIEEGYFIIERIRIDAFAFKNIIRFKKIFIKYYSDMISKVKNTLTAR